MWSIRRSAKIIKMTDGLIVKEFYPLAHFGCCSTVCSMVDVRWRPIPVGLGMYSIINCNIEFLIGLLLNYFIRVYAKKTI